MATNTLLVLIVGLTISSLMLILGIYMLVIGNPSLMHGKDSTTAAQPSLSRLACWDGLGSVIVGIGCIFETLFGIDAANPFPIWMGGASNLIFSFVLVMAGTLISAASIIRFDRLSHSGDNTGDNT